MQREGWQADAQDAHGCDTWVRRCVLFTCSPGASAWDERRLKDPPQQQSARSAPLYYPKSRSALPNNRALSSASILRSTTAVCTRASASRCEPLFGPAARCPPCARLPRHRMRYT